MVASKLSVFACSMLLIIVVLQEVTSRSAINPEHLNTSRDYRRQNRDATEDDEDEDVADYPFNEILGLVKKTKEFLKSPNTTDEDRKKLDIEPGFYGNYLDGDYSDPPSVVSGDGSTTNYPSYGLYPFGYPPNASYSSSHNSIFNVLGPSHGSSSSGAAAAFPAATKRSCQAQYRMRKPKKMRAVDGKDYYIVNVGRDFMQRIKIVVCQNPGEGCNNAITWPENYDYRCQQDFGATRDLLSVPLDKPLDMWQQRKRTFQIPNKCQCQMSRQASS